MTTMPMVRANFTIDALSPDDWKAVRSIYVEGILAGNATFETDAPPWSEWDSAHLPFARIVARRMDGVVVGWAALRSVSSRVCYRGVAEVSVYVSGLAQHQGIGRALLRELIILAEGNGVWTLQGSIFPENQASLRMCEACGFRQVGRRKHIAKLNGLWRDTVLVERRSSKVGVA